MYRLALFSVIAVAAPVCAGDLKPGAPLKSPPRAGTNGGTVTSLPKGKQPKSVADGPNVKVIVTYPTINSAGMKISSNAGVIPCVAPTPGLIFYRCELTVPRGIALTLSATVPSNSPTYASTTIAGKQWGGDCAGTSGEACVLTMDAERNVTLNPATAPE